MDSYLGSTKTRSRSQLKMRGQYYPVDLYGFPRGASYSLKQSEWPF